MTADSIRVISSDALQAIVDHWCDTHEMPPDQPSQGYLAQEGDQSWTAAETATGDCFVESFSHRVIAEMYLVGELDLDLLMMMDEVLLSARGITVSDLRQAIMLRHGLLTPQTPGQICERLAVQQDLTRQSPSCGAVGFVVDDLKEGEK